MIEFVIDAKLVDRLDVYLNSIETHSTNIIFYYISDYLMIKNCLKLT